MTLRRGLTPVLALLLLSGRLACAFDVPGAQPPPPSDAALHVKAELDDVSQKVDQIGAGSVTFDSVDGQLKQTEIELANLKDQERPVLRLKVDDIRRRMNAKKAQLAAAAGARSRGSLAPSSNGQPKSRDLAALPNAVGHGDAAFDKAQGERRDANFSVAPAPDQAQKSIAYSDSNDPRTNEQKRKLKGAPEPAGDFTSLRRHQQETLLKNARKAIKAVGGADQTFANVPAALAALEPIAHRLLGEAPGSGEPSDMGARLARINNLLAVQPMLGLFYVHLEQYRLKIGDAVKQRRVPDGTKIEPWELPQSVPGADIEYGVKKVDGTSYYGLRISAPGLSRFVGAPESGSSTFLTVENKTGEIRTVLQAKDGKIVRGEASLIDKATGRSTKKALMQLANGALAVTIYDGAGALVARGAFKQEEVVSASQWEMTFLAALREGQAKRPAAARTRDVALRPDELPFLARPTLDPEGHFVLEMIKQPKDIVTTPVTKHVQDVRSAARGHLGYEVDLTDLLDSQSAKAHVADFLAAKEKLSGADNASSPERLKRAENLAQEIAKALGLKDDDGRVSVPLSRFLADSVRGDGALAGGKPVRLYIDQQKNFNLITSYADGTRNIVRGKIAPPAPYAGKVSPGGFIVFGNIKQDAEGKTIEMDPLRARDYTAEGKRREWVRDHPETEMDSWYLVWHSAKEVRRTWLVEQELDKTGHWRTRGRQLASTQVEDAPGGPSSTLGMIANAPMQIPLVGKGLLYSSVVAKTVYTGAVGLGQTVAQLDPVAWAVDKTVGPVSFFGIQLGGTSDSYNLESSGSLLNNPAYQSLHTDQSGKLDGQILNRLTPSNIKTLAGEALDTRREELKKNGITPELTPDAFREMMARPVSDEEKIQALSKFGAGTYGHRLSEVGHPAIGIATGILEGTAETNLNPLMLATMGAASWAKGVVATTGELTAMQRLGFAASKMTVGQRIGMGTLTIGQGALSGSFLLGSADTAGKTVQYWGNDQQKANDNLIDFFVNLGYLADAQGKMTEGINTRFETVKSGVQRIVLRSLGKAVPEKAPAAASVADPAAQLDQMQKQAVTPKAAESKAPTSLKTRIAEGLSNIPEALSKVGKALKWAMEVDAKLSEDELKAKMDTKNLERIKKGLAPQEKVDGKVDTYAKEYLRRNGKGELLHQQLEDVLAKKMKPENLKLFDKNGKLLDPNNLPKETLADGSTDPYAAEWLRRNGRGNMAPDKLTLEPEETEEALAAKLKAEQEASAPKGSKNILERLRENGNEQEWHERGSGSYRGRSASNASSIGTKSLAEAATNVRVGQGGAPTSLIASSQGGAGPVNGGGVGGASTQNGSSDNPPNTAPPANPNNAPPAAAGGAGGGSGAGGGGPSSVEHPPVDSPGAGGGGGGGSGGGDGGGAGGGGAAPAAASPIAMKDPNAGVPSGSGGEGNVAPPPDASGAPAPSSLARAQTPPPAASVAGGHEAPGFSGIGSAPRAAAPSYAAHFDGAKDSNQPFVPRGTPSTFGSPDASIPKTSWSAKRPAAKTRAAAEPDSEEVSRQFRPAPESKASAVVAPQPEDNEYFDGAMPPARYKREMPDQGNAPEASYLYWLKLVLEASGGAALTYLAYNRDFRYIIGLARRPSKPQDPQDPIA